MLELDCYLRILVRLFRSVILSNDLQGRGQVIYFDVGYNIE
jgi:hypothetical protein